MTTLPLTPREDPWAGQRECRKNPRTKTWVVLVDVNEAKLDPCSGRWATICDIHSTICNHETQATARFFLAAPEEWCEFCREVIASHQ